MKWIDCQSCGTEFRVVSDVDSMVSFCPFCGDSLDVDTDEEDEYYDPD
jgi:rRNA maturation endonuclease Nob1